MSEKPQTYPGVDRFYGRRKGHTLSQRQQGLMDDLLPKLSVDVSDIVPSNLDALALFSEAQTKVWLEIGFGKGEHMAWQAAHNPDVAFIGCEPYLNGIAGLLTHIDESDIDNIRIYGDDARHILTALPEASVDRLFLLHPDPWPKTRHAKRRFIGPKNLDEIARVLVDGGEFRVGTDHPVYREWTALQMAQREDFTWTAEIPSDWAKRPDDWPETRYEIKSLKEGRPATYFRFVRSSRSIDCRAG